MTTVSQRRRHPRLLLTIVALAAAMTVLIPVNSAEAAYVRISGAGSTWSQNALDQWRRNVSSNYGITVDYAGTGSSDGRRQFAQGQVDFAVSEVPYETEPAYAGAGLEPRPEAGSYAYMPIVAGGTAFMYNLKIGGRQVTNLRLSGAVVTSIFTGVITQWNDPAIAADNPGLALPARRIVPVYRSEGSGTTAQFTTWMSQQHTGLWNAFCQRVGRGASCGYTSYYPQVAGGVGQSGSLGVSGYVTQAQNEGAITYVEYSYALESGFPVAKVLNTAGYYAEPTANSVAVGLLQARIRTDVAVSDPLYLTQDLAGVFDNQDARSYPLSSYSYMLLHTVERGTFTRAKGETLGDFAYYFLCEGQRQAPVLGYSPLPRNLVEAGLAQVARIPGVDTQSIDISRCNNPTFSPDGTNILARDAPQPAACDKQGPTQCTTGTAGAAETDTPPSGAGPGAGGPDAAGGGGGGAGDAQGGGSEGGGTAADGTADAAADAAAGVTDPAAAAAAAAAAGAEPVIDPDTGQVLGAGSSSTSGDQVLLATPTSMAAQQGWSEQHSLMTLAGGLLLGVMLAPPLIARGAATRRAGRRAS